MRTWIAVVVLAAALVWWVQRGRGRSAPRVPPREDASARLLEEALGAAE